MAIVKNFWLQGSSKRLAGAVLYEAMGQTRVRQLAPEVSNPRTESQMNQRVKWANLVNFYRANSSWMKYAFETKKANQSEYNKFMSLNVTGSNIYLTKQEAAMGACICAPYLITQGSLPSIEVNAFNDEYQTNLYLSSATMLDAGVPVATLAQDLITNNPGLRYGDQISIIRITQQANGELGLPFVIVRKYEMLLDAQEQRPWNAFWPEDIVGGSSSGEQDLVAVFPSEASGGFAFILSRTIAGKTYVSSQRIVIVNNEQYIQQYSSEAQLSAAIRSYGESSDAFLSSTTAETNQQAATFNSILSVSTPNNVHVAGSRWVSSVLQAPLELRLNFSSPVTTLPSVVRIDTNVRSLILDNVRLLDGGVIASFPAGSTGVTDEAVFYVRATIDDTFYQIAFQIKNEDLIHGLE